MSATPSTRRVPRTWTFTVAGDGLFPFDMLRYDRCTPKGESDSARIEASARRGAAHFEVTLIGPKPPTEGRWASFGWAVESVE